MRHQTLLSLLFLTILSYGFAQVSSVKRIEFDLKDDFYGESIYEFGEDGLVMVSNSKASGGEVTWKYEKFNNDLERTGEQLLYIEKGYWRDETFRDDKTLYTFFKNKRGEYRIVNYNIQSSKFEEVTGSLEKNTGVSRMAVLGDYAYFTATYKKAPHVFTVNLKTGEHKFSPIKIEGFNSKKLTIENMQLMEESNEVFLIIEAFLNRKESSMYVIRMDDQGGIKDNYNFSQGMEERIISASASNIGDNEYVITGTHSSKGKGASDGMYFSTVKDGMITNINFYSFLELENFLNYLPQKKQEKIEKKKARKESKGKDYSISYLLAPHNIIKVDDGYIFLAEAFYPTYRQEAQTRTTFVNGVATTTTVWVTVFDGYQYTHAFFAKFNEKGEKEWDQSFEMWMAYKPYYVKRFINIAEQKQDAIKLVYASRSRIHSKSFDFSGTILEDESSEEIDTGMDSDKVKRSYSNMSYWYGNYFLAYGSQKIKNKTESDKKKRTVYFINKIQY